MKGRGLALILALALVGCLPTGIVDAPPTTEPLQENAGVLESLGTEVASETPVAEPSILSSEVAEFIGQTRTVCGPVVDARHVRSKGRPTFIYFDKPQPDNTFTVLIWGADRRKFPPNPEDYYEGKTICVDGLIREHSSGPFMEVSDPSQVSVH